MGREQLHAVTSLLRQALIHMLKAEAWPQSRDAPVWRADALDFRLRATDRFVPSMRQRIDIAKLHRQAIRVSQRQSMAWPRCRSVRGADTGLVADLRLNRRSLTGRRPSPACIAARPPALDLPPDAPGRPP